MQNFDAELQCAVASNINMSVPWYIMSAYAYYMQDDPILTDAVFDNLAKIMHTGWDAIEHPHKKFLSLETLSATTYLGEYPLLAVNSLKHMRGTKP